MEQLHDTREGWLSDFLVLVTPRLREAGYRLPEKVKIACGFPVGSRGGKKTLAQCIAPSASADSITEMFVSPVLSDPLKVMGAALHEAGHACVGVEAGHGKPFKRFCDALGLVGKATEALPGPDCARWLMEEILPKLGAYPHAAVDPDNRKKQATRMGKLVCPVSQYQVRTTKKWIAQGTPVAPAAFAAVVAQYSGLSGEDLLAAVSDLMAKYAMRQVEDEGAEDE